MVDDMTGNFIINAGETFKVVSRRAIDVNRALLLHAFDHALGYGLGIANCSRCCARGLRTYFIGAAVVGSAGGKSKKGQGEQRGKPHARLDAAAAERGGRAGALNDKSPRRRDGYGDWPVFAQLAGRRILGLLKCVKPVTLPEASRVKVSSSASLPSSRTRRNTSPPLGL
jgi:hypothetical protein